MNDHSLPDDTPWDALARHFAGELSEPEAEALRRWIAAEPGRERLVGELRQIWTGAAELRQGWDEESALRRIKEVPAGPARVIRLPRFYHGEPMSPWRRAGRWGMRIAAAIAVVAGGAWLVARGVAPGIEGPVPTSEVATPRGQRASLRLPDGTQVTLGPASTIRYAVAPDRGARTVDLEGDAYFVVTHDEARPFIVRTAHGTATDLGTRFGVHAYVADSVLDVVVEEGKVAVQGSAGGRPSFSEAAVLTPGQLARVDARGAVTVRSGVDLEQHLAWTDGRLVFKDTPLREAAVRIGRWYDLEVRLEDGAIGRKHLTASFKDEAAPEVLRLVAASLRLRVERHGRVVTLRPN